VWVALAVMPGWFAGRHLVRLLRPWLDHRSLIRLPLDRASFERQGLEGGAWEPLSGAGAAARAAGPSTPPFSFESMDATTAIFAAAALIILVAAVLHRRRVRPAASAVLAVWFFLGALAGARAAQAVEGGRPIIAPPAPWQTGWFVVDVSRVDPSSEPRRWKGRVWAWLREEGWVLAGRAVPAAGTGEVRPGLWVVKAVSLPARVEPARSFFLGLRSTHLPGESVARRESSVRSRIRSARYRMDCRIAEARLSFSRKLVDRLGEDTGILAAWTFLGPHMRVPDGWAEPFRRTSTVHLLAISGFHMTMLGGLMWMVLRIATGGASWGKWPALAGLGVYCIFVGMPPPAVRAYGGAVLLAFTPAWGRAHRMWDALGWTTAVLPILDPPLPGGASFQLSVSATAGVFLGGGLAEALRKRLRLRLRGRLGRDQRGRGGRRKAGGGRGADSRPGRAGNRAQAMGRAAEGVWLLFAASGGASLLTTPWTMHHFGVTFPLGILANLLAIPAMTLVMICQLGSIAAIALGAGADHPLTAMGRGMGEGLLALIRASAQVCGAWFLAGKLSLASATALSAGAGALLWMALRRGGRAPGPMAGTRLLPRAAAADPPGKDSRGDRPEGEQPRSSSATRLRVAARRNVGATAVAGLLLGGAVALALAPSMAASLGRHRAVLEVRALDVGQGDAWLLRLGSARWLVDLGPGSSAGRDRLVPQLLASGVRRLERVWVTHGDLDHCGGMEDLLRSPIRVDTLVLPWEAPFSERFGTALRESDQRPVVLRQAIPWSRAWTGGLGVDLLHPSTRDPMPGDNDHSFVFLFRSSAGRFLLVGDLEKPLEPAVLGRGGLRPVTVAQLGHHGSRTSGSEAWWQATNPRLAIISVGAGNRFGFPHRETLEAIERHGAVCRRTDQNGRIVVRFEGARLSVATERRPARFDRNDPPGAGVGAAPPPGSRP